MLCLKLIFLWINRFTLRWLLSENSWCMSIMLSIASQSKNTNWSFSRKYWCLVEFFFFKICINNYIYPVFQLQKITNPKSALIKTDIATSTTPKISIITFENYTMTEHQLPRWWSPVSYVDGHQVVKVEATPLFHVRRAGGAQERPAHPGAGAGQEHLGQLLPETRLAVLKQLVGLIHHQPLHPGQQGHTAKLSAVRARVCVCVRLSATLRDVTCWGPELEDPAWAGRWACLEYWPGCLRRNNQQFFCICIL